MKLQKANMKKMPFCPGAGAGTTRDNPGQPTPGHPGTRSRGPPRDTHPGHPGTTCIYEGRGGRGLDTAPGPERRQKYKTYRYIVLCLGGGRGVVPGRRRGMSLARPPWRCKHREGEGERPPNALSLRNSSLPTQTYTHTYIQTYIYTNIHTHRPTCIQTYIAPTYIHAYI